jgi:hypothetical protein
MSHKSQIDAAQCTQLPKLIDNGLNNNYGEWKTKSFHILRSLGLWKYIDGPLSILPVIPSLVLPQTHHGTTDNGEVTTVHIQVGNSMGTGYPNGSRVRVRVTES